MQKEKTRQPNKFFSLFRTLPFFIPIYCCRLVWAGAKANALINCSSFGACVFAGIICDYVSVDHSFAERTTLLFILRSVLVVPRTGIRDCLEEQIRDFLLFGQLFRRNCVLIDLAAQWTCLYLGNSRWINYF